MNLQREIKTRCTCDRLLHLQPGGAMTQRIQPHVLRLPVQFHENVNAMAVDDYGLLVTVLSKQVHVSVKRA
jgi:hypothetical protein